MTIPMALGIAAGALQLLAYAIYAVQVVRPECRPNGMSWLMWSYGTLVVLLVEIDTGAPVSVLILPAVCGLCSLFVASYAFLRGAYIAPEHQDWYVLALDVVLMAAYVALVFGRGPAETLLPDLGLIFVLLTGLSTLTSCWPALRTTCLYPWQERPTAWFVWSAAYGLAALAVMGEGLSWHYLAYPVLSQAINLLIGLFALSPREFAGLRPGHPAGGAGPLGQG